MLSVPRAPVSFLVYSALALLAACGESTHRSTASTPEVRSLAVRCRDNLGLAADVNFDSTGFTAARVRYRAAGGDAEADAGETPSQLVTDGVTTIPVLGLLADTAYDLEVEFLVGTETARTETLNLRTPELPTAFANVRLETVGDTTWPGLVLTDVPTPEGRVLAAFDAMGRVRWYFQSPLIGNFSQRLANGNFGAFIGTTTGWQPTYGYFLEVTPVGEVVARHQAPPPLYTDEHELLLRPTASGGWSTSFFSYDIRIVDLTQHGGRRDARIAGHQILRYDENGTLDFLWNAWDHVDFSELIEPIGGLKEADFDHPNSLAYDSDGNYVVSFRNLGQVRKINAITGLGMWRLGGLRNEFEWQDDDGFSAQHSAVPLANSRLLVFDNGTRHFPQESRAVEYELDVPGRKARKVWEYRHDPPLYTPYTGSVQRLANGNTVVGFAFLGVVTEVNPDGKPVWEGRLLVSGAPVVTYRMKRIGSLYDGE